MTRSVRTLVLAAALAAPMAGSALAQDASGSFGAAEQSATTQAPREFTARRLIETRSAVEAPAAQLDRNVVPSSAF
jgi:Ni/Co efflux regulator RcnB